LLLSKTVKVTWNIAQVKKYTEMGYEFTKIGDEFDLKIEHLKDGSTKKVKVVCDYCGTIVEKAYNTYINGKKNGLGKDCCVKCVGVKRKESDKFYNRQYISHQRLDGDFILQEFIKKGYTPQFTKEEYKDNNQKLPFVCDKHKDKGTQYINYGHLQQGGSCVYCVNEKRGSHFKLNQQYVFDYYKTRGLIVLDNQVYKSKDDKLAFTCVEHSKEIQYISLRGLKKTQTPCKFCRFNNTMTTISRMVRQRLTNWKAEIMLRDNNKCVITGSSNFDVHHLIPLNQIIKSQLKKKNISLDALLKNEVKLLEFIEEIANIHTPEIGIVLDKDLHTKFHQEFGYDFTISDFNKFKQSII
jgi:hypothetical protein